MEKFNKGYIHIYTGNGKGKTTAALGLALRAAGSGMKVFIAQFIKGMKYSEIKALQNYSTNIKVKQYGKGCFVFREPSEEDCDYAKKGLLEVEKIIKSKSFDLIILDEINIAVALNLIDVEDILKIMEEKPEELELVLTGRYAHKKLIKKADLVTEMKEIKHYYQEGVMARTGIER